jgi:hypothetical protein
MGNVGAMARLDLALDLTLLHIVLRIPKKEQKIQNLEVEPWTQGSKVPAHLEVEPMKIHQIQRS